MSFKNAYGAMLKSTYPLSWSNANVNGAFDLALYRDTAGTLAQRNGTNAQTFNIYNTYTDASNYERASLTWDTNVFKINSNALGTGTSRDVHIQAGNAIWQFKANYNTVIPNNGFTMSGGWTLTGSGGKLNVRNSSSTAAGTVTSNVYETYTSGSSSVGKGTGELTTLTTTTATQIASFATTHLGAKLVIQAADTVSGERQMSEILLVHDGTTVTLTEYGVIYTNASLATYTAEISGGNVVVKATSASTNSTTYKVMETLI
jgi:hypothetical protein